MLRVHVKFAKPGMVLALPVKNPQAPDQVLLTSGFTLNGPMIERIRGLRVRYLRVECPSLELAQEFVSERVNTAQGAMADQVGKAFSIAQGHLFAKMDFEAYTRAMGSLIAALVECPAAAVFLGSLDESEDGGLRQHAANVAYLSVLMGLRLEGYVVRQRKRIDPQRAREVTSLGIGAMLHDVGVLELDSEVCEEYRRTGIESAAWQEHPGLGYQALRGRIAPSAATVVLHHHQRFDGSGYAGVGVDPAAGERIHIFSRIAAVADVFDRICNPHTQEVRPAVLALRAFQEPAALTKFDPEVVHALFQVAPPYPPGSLVTLSDGRTGVVVDHNPKDPCKPTVQIMSHGENLVAAAAAAPGATINLAEDGNSPAVVECDGLDVSQYNFPAPPLMQGGLRGWQM